MIHGNVNIYIHMIFSFLVVVIQFPCSCGEGFAEPVVGRFGTVDRSDSVARSLTILDDGGGREERPCGGWRRRWRERGRWR